MHDSCTRKPAASAATRTRNHDRRSTVLPYLTLTVANNVLLVYITFLFHSSTLFNQVILYLNYLNASLASVIDCLACLIKQSRHSATKTIILSAPHFRLLLCFMLLAVKNEQTA